MVACTECGLESPVEPYRLQIEAWQEQACFFLSGG